MEKPGRLQSMGITKSWTQLSDEHFHYSLFEGKVVFMFSFFAFGGIIFTCLFKGLSIICHRRGHFFIAFFCLSPLSKISQSHMGRSTSRFFIPFY